MKTQEEKMKYVVEAAGECWHEFRPFPYMVCNKCGAYQENCKSFPPSPTDLNELFRLAEKMNFEYVIENNDACIYLADFHVGHSGGKTTAEALLNALFIATGGKDNDG